MAEVGSALSRLKLMLEAFEEYLLVMTYAINALLPLDHVYFKESLDGMNSVLTLFTHDMYGSEEPANHSMVEIQDAVVGLLQMANEKTSLCKKFDLFLSELKLSSESSCSIIKQLEMSESYFGIAIYPRLKFVVCGQDP